MIAYELEIGKTEGSENSRQTEQHAQGPKSARTKPIGRTDRKPI